MFVKCSPSSIERRVKHNKSIIFQFIDADKVVFGAIYSSVVVYILTQLFTSVSVKVVLIFTSPLRSSENIHHNSLLTQRKIVP